MCAFLLAAALADAAPPAGDPFDLTFVPTDAPARLIGVRPARLADQPGLVSADKWPDVVGQLVTAVGGDPAAGQLPAAADLAQVLCEGIQLDFPTADRRGNFGTNSGWYVVRTTDPFDWAGLAAAWFPGGEEVGHAGHRYRKAAVKLEAFGGPADQTADLAFFAADSRTLVFSLSEAPVVGLIDRLKAGGRVTPPPLWDAVDRCPVALAACLADRSWLTIPDELPPARPALPPFAALLRGAGAVAVGAEVRGGDLWLTAAVSADDLPGVTDRLRAAAARTGPGPRVWAAAGRATATLRVPLSDAAVALPGGDDR